MAFLLARRPGRRRTLGEIEVGETIGEGANSKVKLGRDRKTGRLVVLKIMDPEVFRTREVQQELEILRYFGEPRNRHPNICGLVSVMHDVELASKHGTPRSSYDTRRVSVIVTEYADGGDLFSYVASGIPFNEETSRAVFQQVVRGVIHLHKHGVVHLDIKPENIIITRTGQVKITDFGLSEIVRPLRSRKGPRRAKALPDSAGPRSSAATRSRAGPIRAVASMTSLESMVPRGGRGPALSMDSSPSPSPLAHFFPSGTPSRRSSAVLGGPPPLCPGSGGRLSTPRASIASAPQFDLDEVRLDGEVVDDDELFAAISTGRTRPNKSDTPPAADDSQPANLQHSRTGIRSSASLNSLVDYAYSGGMGGMGRKVTSCTSISSLDSNISFNSRGSGRSTASRYSAPRLVVNSRSGTLCYQAPEVNYGNYDGSKADVFSLGIVLHVLLYGVLPFENGECFNMNSDISEGAKSFSDGESSPEWCPPKLLQHDIELSEEAVDLLHGMLLLSPQTRFSLKDVARHVWVQAAQVRGSSRLVAALVQRREGHVLESRKNQNYLRKARKRCRGGAAASETMPPEVDDLFG